MKIQKINTPAIALDDITTVKVSPPQIQSSLFTGSLMVPKNNAKQEKQVAERPTLTAIEKYTGIRMNDLVSRPHDSNLFHSKIITKQNKNHRKKFLRIKEEKNVSKHKYKYIHFSYLKKLTRNNPAMMSEMIEVYLEETPKLISAMELAIDNKDWESISTTAHSIIPSFSMMGINTKFETTAKKIQEYAKKKKWAPINELFTKIETVCNQACKELKTELEALKTNKLLQIK